MHINENPYEKKAGKYTLGRNSLIYNESFSYERFKSVAEHRDRHLLPCNKFLQGTYLRVATCPITATHAK